LLLNEVTCRSDWFPGGWNFFRLLRFRLVLLNRLIAVTIVIALVGIEEDGLELESI
jgi:hypothetical protein